MSKYNIINWTEPLNGNIFVEYRDQKNEDKIFIISVNAVNSHFDIVNKHTKEKILLGKIEEMNQNRNFFNFLFK